MVEWEENDNSLEKGVLIMSERVKKLRDAVGFLNEITIPICEKHEDGRYNSTIDEDTIIDLLEEKYGKENIERPPARWWWDVKVFGIPVNIKSSTFKTADNFSSKQAVLYSLTDLTEEEIVRVKDFQTFQKLLKERGKKENGRDYYIIALNKVTNETHLLSLKTLYVLTPNGNNLLFQVNWGKNINPVLRNHSEAYDFLVGAYKKSVQKKVEVHEGYETL